MDSDHTAARSGRVHRPFRFRSVQVGRIKSNGREEREQAAQPVEYDHGGYALLRFRGATYAERFFISQPFTASLAVSARALIGCAAGRTKHLIFLSLPLRPLIALRILGRKTLSEAAEPKFCDANCDSRERYVSPQEMSTRLPRRSIANATR